jgi:hypothetical protein
MLRAVDEGYGHLIGVAPLQFRVAVDINHLVRLPGFGTDGGHLRDCLVAQMAALPSQYDDSLRSLGEVDHVTIFHDAGDAISEAWRVRRRSGNGQQNGTPTKDSSETSRSTP